MKPYFRPNKMGKALLASGKRLRQEPPFGVWVLRYRDEFGRKVREASKCRTEAEAILANAQAEKQAEDVREGRATRKRMEVRTWEELRDAYLAAHAHLSSQAPMRSQFKRWLDPAWKGRALASITPADCEALLSKARKAEQAPATVRQLHIRGRVVFGYAVETLGWLEANPWSRVKRPGVPQKHPVYLRKEQVDSLLMAAGPYRLLLLLAAFTGARKGELAGLRWTDIDFRTGKAGVIHFRRSWGKATTKGKRERVVPIHPGLREELLAAAKRADSELVFPAPRKGGVRHDSWHLAILLRSIAKRAGVLLPEGVTFHGLRHTFATHLYHATGDITAAQRLLGHSTPTLTERVYAGVDLAHLEDAVARLSFGTEHKMSTEPNEGQEGERRVSENPKEAQAVGGSSLPRRRPSDFIFLLKERHSPLVSAGNSSGNAATYAAPAVSARPCWPPLRATVEHIPNTRRAA